MVRIQCTRGIGGPPTRGIVIFLRICTPMAHGPVRKCRTCLLHQDQVSHVSLSNISWTVCVHLLSCVRVCMCVYACVGMCTPGQTRIHGTIMGLNMPFGSHPVQHHKKCTTGNSLHASTMHSFLSESDSPAKLEIGRVVYFWKCTSQRITGLVDTWPLACFAGQKCLHTDEEGT